MWIEITTPIDTNICAYESLPTRECGLKSRAIIIFIVALIVTPYAGVWIEIFVEVDCGSVFYVTPYAGVWIEIQ